MEAETTPAKSASRTTLVLRWAVGILVVALLAAGGWLAHAYAGTPEALRHPKPAHYHFRLQVINNGTPVNFAGAKFQEPEGTVCTEALTAKPMHFHDNLDQFVHIHWAGMTGGLLLKNYGWNLIGGPDGTLGYRFDQLPKLIPVPVHGQALPKPPAGVHYYVYSSPILEPTNYRERSWNDFLKQDFKTFFGAKAPAKQSFLEWLAPAAYAHGDEEHLAALNDVLGNVVVFAQATKPNAEQISDRFTQLVPLPESSCGG